MDANFTNLNTDKLQDIVSDTTPQLGGNLDVNGQTITSTSDADITITPNGTGNVNLSTDTVRVGDNNANATLTTDGTGDLIINTNAGTNSGSITVADGVNGNISITPNGTGAVVLDGISYPQADGSANQLLKTDGSGNLSFTNASGFDGDLAGSTLTDSTRGVNINSSAANKIKFINADGASTDGSILMNTFAFGTAIISAMEFRTVGDNRLYKLEARGSTDDGSHDAYMYLSGETNQILSKNAANNAFKPLELRTSQVKIFDGSNFRYSLPTADGSANQVIKTNGSGTLSFADDTSSSFDGNLAGNALTDASGDLTIKPNGSTDAKLKVLDNGSDSVTLQLGVDSADAVGGSVTVVDQSSNRGPFQFTSKTMAFDAATGGGSSVAAISFKTASATDEIHFLPNSSQNKPTTIALDGSNNTHLSLGGDDPVVEHGASGNITLEPTRTTLGQPLLFNTLTTTQRNALSSPTDGSVIYNSTDSKLQVRIGSSWVNLH